MFHPDGPTLLELMRQGLSSTDRGYDLIAPKFDHTPFRTPNSMLAKVAQVVGPVRSGIDLCCGTGAAAWMLRDLCSERVVGVDRSAGMLGEAQRRADASEGGPEMEWLQGDVLDLHLAEQFDVVTFFGARGHILPQDESRLIASAHRLLAPGGRFVFQTRTLPPVLSRRWAVLRGFNAAMRVRNLVLRPAFIMYYLTFLWPDVEEPLNRAGFDVVAHDALFAPPFQDCVIVEATRR